MKKIFLLFLIIPFIGLNAQKIGKMATDTSRIIFPGNSWGANLIFSEGGFGFGTFLRTEIGKNLTGFVDFSVSEAKDEREFEYIDYYGNTYTFNKKNRVYLFPLNFGLQYRMFSNALTDNMRPYISIGIGPTFVATDPYSVEFFDAIKYAKLKVAAGAYICIGTNFGTDKSSLLGVNIKYSFVQFFDDGVENLINKYLKSINTLSVSLDIGIQY